MSILLLGTSTAVPSITTDFHFALEFQTKNAWKFPGGLSDPGENIGECHAQQSKKKKQQNLTVHLAKSFTA